MAVLDDDNRYMCLNPFEGRLAENTYSSGVKENLLLVIGFAVLFSVILTG